MGYTHYFPRKKDVTTEQWGLIKAATAQVLELCRAEGIELRAEYDTVLAMPELTKDHIMFNGLGDDGHETFVLDRHSEDLYGRNDPEYPFGFDFCKTAMKPYDIAVVAVLAIANHYAPGAWEIGSDGDFDDWYPGIKMATKACLMAECEMGLHPYLSCPPGVQGEEDAA